MAYYHASQIGGIKELEPRISNHNVPLIYFSDKRENVLVYLSNAVEKVCKEAGFQHEGLWYKWGPYGFQEDGKLRLDEYYPNALEDTYKGVSGYIYSADQIVNSTEIDIKIPNAFISSQNTQVDSCEYVKDAYEEILAAESRGEISILRYKEFISDSKRAEWLKRIIQKEYEESTEHPEYKFFLEKKFGEIINNLIL